MSSAIRIESVSAVIIFLQFLSLNDAFNVSPNPNIILREPQYRSFMPKTRSSYFGFTINLKRDR